MTNQNIKRDMAVARRWTATPPAVSSLIFEHGNRTANLWVIGQPALTTDLGSNVTKAAAIWRVLQFVCHAAA